MCHDFKKSSIFFPFIVNKLQKRKCAFSFLESTLKGFTSGFMVHLHWIHKVSACAHKGMKTEMSSWLTFCRNSLSPWAACKWHLVPEKKHIHTPDEKKRVGVNCCWVQPVSYTLKHTHFSTDDSWIWNFTSSTVFFFFVIGLSANQSSSHSGVRIHRCHQQTPTEHLLASRRPLQCKRCGP